MVSDFRVNISDRDYPQPYEKPSGFNLKGCSQSDGMSDKEFEARERYASYLRQFKSPLKEGMSFEEFRRR